jgi:hypothetical protein
MPANDTAAAAELLVEGGQRGGDLERGESAAADAREERSGGAARHRQVVEAALVEGREGVAGAEPGGGGEAARPLAEDRHEGGDAAVELRVDRLPGQPVEAVLPGHVVPGVQPHLVPGGLHRRQRGTAALADLRGGQQGAVEGGAPAVHAGGVGAQHLGQKAAPAEDAQHGASGVVRPEGEEEARPDPRRRQVLEQRRHSVAGAAEGVDVDLERDARRGGRLGGGHGWAAWAGSAGWPESSAAPPLAAGRRAEGVRERSTSTTVS